MQFGVFALKTVKVVFAASIGIVAVLTLYSLPAMMTLPRGTRPGIEELTISEAADQLRETGTTDWELVEEARAVVAERMAYSRRNSFDGHRRAFARGYGYCQQQSFALEDLLTQLGFEAKVVQAYQNELPDGQVTAHSWVSVTIDGETRYIDTLHYDAEAENITFTPQSEVLDYTPAFRLMAGWGAAPVNAYRYYKTGVDY
jgi:hypothetical protein